MGGIVLPYAYKLHLSSSISRSQEQARAASSRMMREAFHLRRPPGHRLGCGDCTSSRVVVPNMLQPTCVRFGGVSWRRPVTTVTTVTAGQEQ